MQQQNKSKQQQQQPQDDLLGGLFGGMQQQQQQQAPPADDLLGDLFVGSTAVTNQAISQQSNNLNASNDLLDVLGSSGGGANNSGSNLIGMGNNRGFSALNHN